MRALSGLLALAGLGYLLSLGVPSQEASEGILLQLPLHVRAESRGLLLAVAHQSPQSQTH